MSSSPLTARIKEINDLIGSGRIHIISTPRSAGKSWLVGEWEKRLAEFTFKSPPLAEFAIPSYLPRTAVDQLW